MKDDTVMQILKKFLWYKIANSTIEDVKVAIFDATCLWNVAHGENATIHLQKKHLPFIVKRFVNYWFRNQQYVVTSIKYRFYGMDVFISRK